MVRKYEISSMIVTLRNPNRSFRTPEEKRKGEEEGKRRRGEEEEKKSRGEQQQINKSCALDRGLLLL